jgi:P-type Cu+ transporter
MDHATHEHAHSHSHARGADAVPPGKAIDPVCGMTVDIATAKHTHVHRGKTW